VGVRGLKQPAPYVQENLINWGRESHNKGDKPGLCPSRGKEMQITQTQAVEVLHSKPPDVPVETRWCIGVVLSYSIIEVTFF
jgi:hypothetical protein